MWDLYIVNKMLFFELTKFMKQQGIIISGKINWIHII